jgi:hypothetical protein
VIRNAAGLALALILAKEYPYWAPRLGAVLLRLAARLVPRPMRATRRAEWFAELDMLKAEGLHGLIFSVTVLALSPKTAIADRRNMALSAAPVTSRRRGPTTKTRFAMFSYLKLLREEIPEGDLSRTVGIITLGIVTYGSATDGTAAIGLIIVMVATLIGGAILTGIGLGGAILFYKIMERRRESS